MIRKLLFYSVITLLAELLVGCSVTSVDHLHSKYAFETMGDGIFTTSDPIGVMLNENSNMAMVSLSQYQFYRGKCGDFQVCDAGIDTLPIAFAKGQKIAADFEIFLRDSSLVPDIDVTVAVPDSSYLFYGDFCEIIRRFSNSAKFVVADSDNIGDMVLSGEVNMALCADDERLAYSTPFFCDPMVIMKYGDVEREKIISGPDDLVGMSIAVTTGSVQEIYVSDNFKESEIIRVESLPDVYLQLNQGKADAAFFAEPIWRTVAKDYPDLCSVADGLNPFPIAIAFNTNESKLREAFNSFQRGLIDDNEIEPMIDQWYDSQSGRNVPSLDGMEFPNGTLNIAYYSCVPPFCYIKDGKPCGAEVELVTRFAMHMGMKPNFIDMNFQSVIPYVQSGKAQIAMCTLCITEERSKQVDFAEPWTYEGTCIVVGQQHAPDSLRVVRSGKENSFVESFKGSIRSNLIEEDRWKLFLDGLLVTVVVSLLSAIFGTLLGIVLCFMSMSKNAVMAKSSDLFIEFMRRMPQVVLLMILFYVVFATIDITGVWVAVVGFTLCFGAYTSVIFRSAVESIDKGQTEAGLSMGFNRFKTFYYFILPQVIMRALPVYKGEFIGLVKATSIVGYIAVLDLTKAGDIVRSRTFEAFFPLILVTVLYFLVIWILSLIIKYFQIKSRPRRYKYSHKNRAK